MAGPSPWGEKWTFLPTTSDNEIPNILIMDLRTFKIDFEQVIIVEFRSVNILHGLTNFGLLTCRGEPMTLVGVINAGSGYVGLN